MSTNREYESGRLRTLIHEAPKGFEELTDKTLKEGNMANHVLLANTIEDHLRTERDRLRRLGCHTSLEAEKLNTFQQLLQNLRNNLARLMG